MRTMSQVHLVRIGRLCLARQWSASCLHCQRQQLGYWHAQLAVAPDSAAEHLQATALLKPSIQAATAPQAAPQTTR